MTALSPEDYGEEVLREDILDSADHFYREGGHQLNVVRFQGKTIAATDAKEYHAFCFLACFVNSPDHFDGKKDGKFRYFAADIIDHKSRLF